MPGPAPPVVDGLQIDEALDFQRRFDRVQRVVWWLLALVPFAAIAGLFGGGLFSETTAGGADTGFTVTYDRFGRLSADTQLEVELDRAPRTAEVAISSAFLDRYVLTEVRPEPQRTTATADRVIFSFAGRRPTGTATFSLQPDAVGLSSGDVTVAGGAPVHINQFVYP